MTAIKITGLTEIRSDLSRVAVALKNEPIMLRVASDARNLIHQRTLSGRDIDLQPFKRYSDEPIYLPKDHRPRPKGGRRIRKRKGPGSNRLKTVAYDGGYAQFARETKGDDKVNLFASGAMFRSFQARQVSPTRAIVAFNSRLQANKALGNQKNRRFVGLNKSKEVPLLNKIAARMVTQTISRLGL